MSCLLRGTFHRILTQWPQELRQLRAMSKRSSTKPKVAIGQMRATNDKQHNLDQVKSIVARAKESDAQFVFLPECCDYVGTHRAETLQLSEPLTGATVAAYRELAKQHNIWLSLGGIHESIVDESKPGDIQRVYNTHIVINSAGDLVAKYRKLHMFNVVTPEFEFRESQTVKSGQEIVPPVDTPVGNIGLQICYDMRFSEPSTILRKGGAEVLTYPSAFAVSTGRAHWEVLLRARAIENQCFVLAAAQRGFHNKKRESYGSALAVSPWGVVLGKAEEQDLDVVIVELDYESLESVRKNMPCFGHRRDDVYNLSARNAGPHSLELLPQQYLFGGIDIPKDTIFYTSEHSYAFTNIRCVVPGHVLVSTKRSAARLLDLSPPEISDFFQTVCTVQKAAEKLYNATSCTVTVQDGPDAGQTVFHVHCHVMPRHEGDFPESDQIYTELKRHDKEPQRPRRSAEEMASEAARFREAIATMVA